MFSCTPGAKDMPGRLHGSSRPTSTLSRNSWKGSSFGGIIYSRSAGKTRVYALNPRYPFLAELNALMDKALSFYPAAEKEELVRVKEASKAKG